MVVSLRPRGADVTDKPMCDVVTWMKAVCDLGREVQAMSEEARELNVELENNKVYVFWKKCEEEFEGVCEVLFAREDWNARLRKEEQVE